MLTVLPSAATFQRTTAPFSLRRADTTKRDESLASAELAAALHEDPDLVFVFVSIDYDLDALGAALAAAFPTARVVGCTTSGQIGSDGYRNEGIAATSFAGLVSCIDFLIEPLDGLEDGMDAVSDQLTAHLSSMTPNPRRFGFLLADGLSMMEERLIAALDAGAGEMPIVGGSAGDDLKFEATHVLHQGKFRRNAAVLSVVETPVPFAMVHLAHHAPTERRMVITRADPDQRLVYEIDGRSAAEVYAEMVQRPVEELGPDVFSQHPVMLPINDGHYIRSIQKIEPGGAIRFYCAIERGLVIRLAEPVRVMETLEESFAQARAELGGIDLVLGCDCILRRLELESLGMDKEVGEFLSDNHVVGFSTYGEQLHGVHVNQTFVGIALRSEA